MAPKMKASISISVPFDARHVSGANIPGFTNPVAASSLHRSYTSIQPDLIPTHSFATSGTSEVSKPKRANSLASSLSRPSLRLKTSISRLRARSNSNSPDTHPKREPEHAESAQEENKENQHPAIDMSTASLRKKPSLSRLRERSRSSPTAPLDPPPQSTPDPSPLQKSLLSRHLPQYTSKPPLKTTPISLPTPSHTHTHPHSRTQPTAPPPPKTYFPPRPTRADSGTAVDFTHLRTEDRPLGFREIIAVNSFQQRMALYKRTREYWATCDHGLNEWVGKAAGGPRRAMVSYA